MTSRVFHRAPRSVLIDQSTGTVSMTSSSTVLDKQRNRLGATSVPHRISIAAVAEHKRNLTPIKRYNASKTNTASDLPFPTGNASKIMTRPSKPQVAVSNAPMFTGSGATAAPAASSKVVLPPLIVAHRAGNQANNTTSNANNANSAAPSNSIYVCKGNNDQMIRAYFSKLKWTILDQSMRFFTKYQFKWVECINEIDWAYFNPNTQIVNHIQNISIIGTKSGLVQTVKDFEYKDKALASSFGGMHSSKFMPLTFRLDTSREELSPEEQAFMNTKNNGLWINKPTNYNCGKGIHMVSDIKKFKDELLRQKNATGKGKSNTSTATASSAKSTTVFHRGKSIIQRYLEKPLLLDKRKFDMRVYVFIVSTAPLCVLFNPGYLRLSMQEYKLDNVDDVSQKYTHLTNAAIQKKHPDFATQKENTIWSVQKFHEYIQQEQGVTQEQIDTMQKKIKEIFVYVLRAAEKKIDKKTGCFELMGCDILLGSDLTPYLIEMNHNPALHLDTIVQSEVIPGVVRDALDIALLVHQKTQDITTILRDPSFDHKGFQPLINDATGYSFLASSIAPSSATMSGSIAVKQLNSKIIVSSAQQGAKLQKKDSESTTVQSQSSKAGEQSQATPVKENQGGQVNQISQKKQDSEGFVGTDDDDDEEEGDVNQQEQDKTPIAHEKSDNQRTDLEVNQQQQQQQP